jgi:hypothetical protein
MIKWKYKPSGKCPVQSEGYFMGWYFYFRSRHSTAVIEFSKTEAGWENGLIHGRYVLWTTKEPSKAGWLKPNFCKVLIWIGCIRFFFQRNKQNNRIK